jgi:hypothetical protein
MLANSVRWVKLLGEASSSRLPGRMVAVSPRERDNIKRPAQSRTRTRGVRSFFNLHNQEVKHALLKPRPEA